MLYKMYFDKHTKNPAVFQVKKSNIVIVHTNITTYKEDIAFNQ